MVHCLKSKFIHSFILFHFINNCGAHDIYVVLKGDEECMQLEILSFSFYLIILRRTMLRYVMMCCAIRYTTTGRRIDFFLNDK